MKKNKTNIAFSSESSIVEAVKAIKSAILHSRYQAAKLVNKELLSLYYNVGGYISKRSRTAQWGANALTVISQQLQQELLGLRGFSVTNLKRMRTFYEAWNEENIFRPLMSDDLEFSAQDAMPSNRALATHDSNNKTPQPSKLR